MSRSVDMVVEVLGYFVGEPSQPRVVEHSFAPSEIFHHNRDDLFGVLGINPVGELPLPPLRMPIPL